MESLAKPIAIIQGAEGREVQRLFGLLVEKWQGSHRIAGVIERPEAHDPDSVHLRTIGGGHDFRLFQELGAGSTACALDPEGPVMASEVVRRDIALGCDLVLISKFGKLEAENRSGLIGAFATAMEAGVPVLTSVAPRFDAAWALFAGSLFVTLPPDLTAIEKWWAALRA